VLALLIVLASVGGLTTVAMQSKFVPYVVPQDNLGGWERLLSSTVPGQWTPA
jgi:type IV secretory pathway TrbF-like protein